jgi:hypothetical protein
MPCAGQGGINLLGNKEAVADQDLVAGNIALVGNFTVPLGRLHCHPWEAVLCPDACTAHVQIGFAQRIRAPGLLCRSSPACALLKCLCAGLQIGNITLGVPVRMYRKNKHRDSDWGEKAAHLVALSVPRHCMHHVLAALQQQQALASLQHFQLLTIPVWFRLCLQGRCFLTTACTTW